jgi:hypothetical protein
VIDLRFPDPFVILMIPNVSDFFVSDKCSIKDLDEMENKNCSMIKSQRNHC